MKSRRKKFLKKIHGNVSVARLHPEISVRNVENRNQRPGTGLVPVELLIGETSVQIAERKDRIQLLFINVAIVDGRQTMHHVSQDSVQTAEARSIVKSKEGYKCRE